MSYDAIENFKRFLFMRNKTERVETLCHNIHGCSLNKYLSNNKPSSFIDHLCSWGTTKEGRYYWQNLNGEWHTTLFEEIELPGRNCKSIW